MVSSSVGNTTGTSDLPAMPVPDERRCPFGPPPEYARLRAESPVTKVVCPTGLEAWLVTRYADVREVLGDPERFSNRASQAAHILGHMRPDEPVIEGQFSRMDGADHLRFRRILGPEISRVQRIRELRPLVQQAVDERIDAMAEAGPPADLYGDFAKPVTTAVIAEMLGVPAQDRGLFQSAAEALFDATTSPEKMAESLGPLFAYLNSLVEQRRNEPGEDVISRMIVRGAKGEPFTDVELSVAAAGLLMAGYDTTASMIGYGVLALLRHPEQFAALRADSSLIPRAVEELVRYLGVGFGLMRVATRDTEVAGQAIAAGDYLVVSIQSANFDSELYSDAERLDVARDAGPHLGFGYGPHQCVGQQLARLELAVALETLIRRVPTLRLAVPFEQVEFKRDNTVQGPAALPVSWDEVG